MSTFNLEDYENVETRLQKYLKKYPDARILTKVEFRDEKTILIRASVYQTGEQLVARMPHATGYAEETRGDGYVNKTSHVENCETSAIGRALANAGFSGNKNGQRASKEEMEKVQRLASLPAKKEAVSEAVVGPQNGSVTESKAQVCETCGATAVERQGVNKAGKAYHGIFCSTGDATHIKWIPVAKGGETA